MKLTSFFDRFPELITKEFRNVFIEDHPVIPAGNLRSLSFIAIETIVIAVRL